MLLRHPDPDNQKFQKLRAGDFDDHGMGNARQMILLFVECFSRHSAPGVRCGTAHHFA